MGRDEILDKSILRRLGEALGIGSSKQAPSTLDTSDVKVVFDLAKYAQSPTDIQYWTVRSNGAAAGQMALGALGGALADFDILGGDIGFGLPFCSVWSLDGAQINSGVLNPLPLLFQDGRFYNRVMGAHIELAYSAAGLAADVGSRITFQWQFYDGRSSSNWTVGGQNTDANIITINANVSRYNFWDKKGAGSSQGLDGGHHGVLPPQGRIGIRLGHHTAAFADSAWPIPVAATDETVNFQFWGFRIRNGIRYP